MYCKFGNIRDNLIFAIFANLFPREFKVLAYKDLSQALYTASVHSREFKSSLIIRKCRICEIKVTRKFPDLQYNIDVFEN